jgi:RHS repeat-associated protein
MMMVENTGAPLADLAGTNPSSGTARYYFGDNLGSTRRLRNASKTSLGQYEYQPYGTPYSETGATPKYKFAGMYYSPDLGTYYTLNRFYNPTLARWTTRDPLGMVDGPNGYAYVGGNPIGNADPTGNSIIGGGVILITGVMAFCIARAEHRARKGPQGVSTQHCVFGCELAKCAGKILGSKWTAYAINWYFENWQGRDWDSAQDDEATRWGADEASKCADDCGDTCSAKYPPHKKQGIARGTR